jgi:hypothetical protein
MTNEKPPESSSSPALPPAPSSSPASASLTSIGHVISGATAAVVAWQAARWLPECLALIRLPSGTVSHDPWAWAPFVLDLAAVVAVAAPVSFKNLLEAAKGFLARGSK